MKTNTELKVIYGHAKSFYGKAQITSEGHLQSYGTIVVKRIVNVLTLTNTTLYTQTTGRHVKEFLLQNGVDVEFKTLKQMIDDSSYFIDSEGAK